MDELEQHLQNFAAGDDLYLHLYLGCHKQGDSHVFRVWAPHAQQVWLVGDFNNWEKTLPMVKTATAFGKPQLLMPDQDSFTSS